MKAIAVWAGFILGCGLAQETAQLPGIFRATLLEWDGSDSGGSFSVRAATDNRVHRCTFTSKTFFERDHKRTFMSKMSAGDPVEVLLDRAESHGRCVALIVRVVDENSSRPPSVYRTLLRGSRSPTETFAPRGNLTYGGIVVRLTGEWMLLRTRSDGEKTILLRQDTRYSAEGTLSDRGTLRVNTRVFVRAGRTLENEIEAYAVMWGQILHPE
jgi:hypothetical protein